MSELKPITLLKIKAIAHIHVFLTQWEQKFIASIEGSKQLSAKQKMTVDDIYQQRVKGEYTGAGIITESWDDVHDFAR